MKKFLLAAMTMSSVAFAQQMIIDAPVDHMYLPEGFDNNDNVEFVVTGHFPNTCYAKNLVKVDVVDDVIDVKVTATLTQPDDDQKGIFCAEMIVPFKEQVTVGTLQGGKYKIVVNGNTFSEIQNELMVQEASSNNVDDYLYASVDYIQKDLTDPSKANLVGYTPSDCVKFDRVEYHSNKRDTISVLPIMKKVSDFCPMKMTPFYVPVKFDYSTIKHENVLIFTRTMDGKSVNTIIRRKFNF